MSPDIDNKRFRKNIRELHNKYHPEAIFMTQTSSTLYGWAIKEVYKSAWPAEKVPKIITIDVSPLRDIEGAQTSGVNENSEGFVRLQNEVEQKLRRYKVHGAIAVIDETRGFSIANTPRGWLSYGYPDFEPDNLGNAHKTLAYAYSVVRKASKKFNPDNKVVCLGLGGDRAHGGPWHRLFGERQKKNLESTGKAYRRYSAQSDEGKYSKERISEFKKWGREIGGQIREEEGKKNLEGKVVSAIAVGCLALSILFMSNNLTGNVISGLNQTSSNWIGSVLFLVGLVGAFAYFKKR